MKNLRLIGLLVLAAVIGIFFWQSRLRSETPIIAPAQLIPLVSAQTARETICWLKQEGLLALACQEKFARVSKADKDKVTELLNLLDQVQNDTRLSAYDRLLLGQAIFAALPTKDSPEAKLFPPTLVSSALAQPKTMSQAEFKQLMARDLQNMVDRLPKDDNAWVINVMVSQYSWKEGKPQPLYSHQYAEVFDPFPNNPNVDTRDITYHVQAIVGSKASSQTGTSEMMAYSFTITSWKSEAYGPTEEKFLVKKENFSDTSYRGEAFLETLLNAVPMPSRQRTIQTEAEPGSPKKITCEQWQDNYQAWKETGEGDKCPWWILKPEQKLIWCANTEPEIRAYVKEGDWLGTEGYMAANAPKYSFDFDEEVCLKNLR